MTIFHRVRHHKLQGKQLKIWGHLDNLSHLWWDESSLQNRGMLLGKMFWSRLSEEFAFYYKLEAVVWDLQPVPYVRFFLFGRFRLDMFSCSFKRLVQSLVNVWTGWVRTRWAVGNKCKRSHLQSSLFQVPGRNIQVGLFHSFHSPKTLQSRPSWCTLLSPWSSQEPFSKTPCTLLSFDQCGQR